MEVGILICARGQNLQKKPALVFVLLHSSAAVPEDWIGEEQLDPEDYAIRSIFSGKCHRTRTLVQRLRDQEENPSQASQLSNKTKKSTLIARYTGPDTHL